MRANVWFVKCCCVQHNIHTLHALLYELSVQNGPDFVCKFFQVQNIIGDLPILLVVDKKQYVARGAEMGFFVEDDKLKFAINDKAIEETGIKISHSILEKARPVNR